MTIKKSVRCPQCKSILECCGSPGDIIQINCPHCGKKGKVTFNTYRSPIQNDNVAIEILNLKKLYGPLTAVDSISFSVKKGEIFAFLGPNGAGKTTTVEMIESIREPTEGEIKILGFDIKQQFDAVKEQIGILPQEFSSFERLTVKETLRYFSVLYKKRADIDEIIHAMDLGEHKNKLYRNLSGGLKQRVGVAIALVNDPDIIFLDEPTTGLDPKARREVWNVIARLRERGKTIFLTTHYMEEAEYLADHIAIIHKGKIIAEGTLEDLITRYGRGIVVFIKKCTLPNAAELLKQKGFQAKAEGNGNISIPLEYNDQLLEILSNLRHEGIEYETIHIKRSNLEEVFLHLTGSRLSEE